MQRNYWQEYWDNYYKFMAMYLGEVQNNYPNADMRKEYIEVSRLFEPPVSPAGYNNNMNSNMNNSNMNNYDMMNDEYMMDNYDMMDSQDMINNQGMMNNEDMINGNNMNNNLAPNNNQQYIQPNMGEVITPSMSPGNGISNGQTMSGNGMYDYTFVSPAGGQFNMNNCRRMAVVRIEMRNGFVPSNFFMLVEGSDRTRIQGFRMDMGTDEIQFIPATVEYRNINNIECAV